MIIEQNLIDRKNYQEKYNVYEKVDFIYNHFGRIIETNKLIDGMEYEKEKDKIPKLSIEFYKGFELHI